MDIVQEYKSIAILSIFIHTNHREALFYMANNVSIVF